MVCLSMGALLRQQLGGRRETDEMTGAEVGFLYDAIHAEDGKIIERAEAAPREIFQDAREKG